MKENNKKSKIQPMDKKVLACIYETLEIGKDPYKRDVLIIAKMTGLRAEELQELTTDCIE